MREEEEEKYNENENEKPPRRSWLKVLGVVLVVLLLLVGGGVFLAMRLLGLGQSGEVEEPPGPLYHMEEFTVNLAEEKGRGLLKVSLVLDLGHEGQAEELDTYETVLRDEIIAILRKYTIAELQEEGSYEELKEDIKKRINEILPDNGVEEVYFTEFLISG